MSPIRRLLIITALAGAVVALPSLAGAQSRGRGIARGSLRVAPRGPVIRVAPLYRPYYYPLYRPGFSLGFYYGGPWGWGPWASGYSYWADAPYYRYPSYGVRAYPGYAARAYGGVRLDLPQRDAEVSVDGYYAGTVDDFSGRLQPLDLEPGPHHIDIRADGFEPVSFDVNVEAGRTITYRAALRPARP